MARILVVDDDESIRLLYKEELQQEGHEVITAATAAEGLALVESARPDLVTLDIKMPGQDGLTALREFKARYRNLPVIMCTAYGSFKKAYASIASDAYVVKSADTTELKNAVSRVLSGRR
ncbi:MAG TPA: response regulator [Thermodesulfobacteriota bacterium]